MPVQKKAGNLLKAPRILVPNFMVFEKNISINNSFQRLYNVNNLKKKIQNYSVLHIGKLYILHKNFL